MLIPSSRLEWSAFECELRFSEPVFFDEFIGAVLRNALGYSLKNVSDPSSYRYLFETLPTRPLPDKRYSKIPHPFVLRALCQGQTWLATGESLHFNLTLIGNGISYFSYFLEALRHMGSRGIGLRQSRFKLAKVESVGLNGERRLVLSEGDSSYSQRFFRISPEDVRNGASHSNNMLLSFLTPVRLKAMQKHIMPDDFTFEIYLRRLVERIRALGYFHDRMSWFELDKSLIEQARSIRWEGSLHWQDWTVWMNRRRQKLGGLVGQVLLQGELSPFCRALDMATWLNIGNNTSYGFGAVAVQYLSELA